MSLLEQLPERARVCFIRIRSLGDCVLTTPALQLLQSARPDLAISVAVENRFAPVFEEHPAVQKLLQPTWQAVRRWNPELCVNFHGGTRSQWMTALSGARWRAGFAHHSMTFAYNIRIPRAQRILGVNRKVHTAEHLASAVFALGVPVQEVPRAQLVASPLRWEAGTKDQRKIRYAVLHGFASSPEKQWSPDHFCELARFLKLWSITPIFLGGPQDDVTPFNAHRVFRGTLSETKSLLASATVFVGNDSGPAHIAAAFGIPSVVLFSTSDPVVWGPWRTESELVLAPDGMSKVPVSRVIAALERLRVFEEAHA